VRPLLHAILALILVGLQAALLRHVGGGAFTLCLPVALLVHLALTAELVEGTVAAAAVGYVLDVASGGTKGLLTSLAVATFLAVRIIRLAVEVRGWASFAALCGLASFGLSAGALALSRSVAPLALRPAWSILPRVALAALLTALLAPLLLWALRRLDGLLGAPASDLAP
jgi:rod shape-determining protein MreD